MIKLFRMSLVALVLVSMATAVQAQDLSGSSVASTPIVSASSSESQSWKGRKALGVTVLGYYEINSDFTSLYFDFGTTSAKTAGFGFGGFFEFGISDKFSVELSTAYSRMTYASRQKAIINENYFAIDAVAHYHFLNNKRFDTYAIMGVGALVSSGAVAPLLDVGVGNLFKVSDNFGVKAELIYKTAIVLNRVEARVGISYSF